jgi:hypothetical protein
MTSAVGAVNRPSTPEDQGADYRRFVKDRSRRALLLTLAAALILVLSGHKPAARGVALGGLFSVINFIIMSRTLAGRLTRTGWSGRTFGFVWILVRLLLMALPLVLAFKSGYLDIAGTAAGLFAVQAALLLEPLFSRFTGRGSKRD